ncbi:uncharacterized protein LOC126573147 [Anopheles aquasalis]|uniref:uncharacterized protein LOC126573147 n=1 Tax=Anopheles aquasalis TaxID=42839 RepID=UPI00215A6925|nr:uncharacterized protein LOC126573147 [Anopheles aquasalis]XP_050088999.1 uncharacterized protein LOC126573147 [Anopheles aquasalis]
MEESTISMQMDVKLDIRERKLEFSHMKSWSQYFVKIEAVKCFPCYMRISFFSSPNDRTTDLIVRINIPGLTVQMATSRTKQHSYGLFWKNNRKRCCAYFAFETQLMCERHLRWMKKSIRNLELYRQEMMQLRRASRTPACEIRREMQPLALMAPPSVMVPSALGFAAWDDLGIYQNLDYTGNVMDLQDFLGPLPTVPCDQSGQLYRPQSAPSGGAVGESHRDSAMSGIYEEIRDTGTDQVNSQLSRLSIASGIYEEMRPVSAERSKGVQEEPTTPPPPLPPRRRLNTNEDMEDELNRSLPTPEMDSLKKKRNWLRLDAVFGRKRTTSGDSQGSSSLSRKGQASKKPGLEQEKSGNTSPVAVVHRKNVCRLRFGGNKRNSFSSPDLSRLQIDIEPVKATGDDELAVGNTSYDNLSDGNGSCTSEFYPQHNIDYIELDFGSSEYLNMSIASSSGGLELETENRSSAPDGRRLNISERILEGFNRSANSSTVNLVGMACSASIPETEEPMEETSSVRHESACDKQQNTGGYIEMGAPGTGFNRQKLIEQGDEEKKQAPKSIGDNGSESIYMIMTGGGKHPEPIRSSSTSSSSSSSSGVSSASDRSVISIDSCSVPMKRNSVDDKIPSYYPNEEILRLPPRKISTDTCSPKVVVVCPDKSPFYGNCTPVASQSATTLPRTFKSAQRPVAEATQDMQDRVQETFRTPKPVHRRHFTAGRNALEAQPGDCMGSSPESSPKLFPKYATFSRGSSSKAMGADSVSPLSSGKRFSSMSRFGKIDFTPLRLKINSVLQRQGSGDVFKTP